MATQNSDNTRKGNAPVERFEDKNIKASIFRNTNREGNAFFSVTFTRTYKKPGTDEYANTNSFSGTDLLKLRRLCDQAYHAVDRLSKQERSQSKERRDAPQTSMDLQQDHRRSSGDLAAQRDTVMKNANRNRAPDSSDHSHTQTQENAPTYER